VLASGVWFQVTEGRARVLMLYRQALGQPVAEEAPQPDPQPDPQSRAFSQADVDAAYDKGHADATKAHAHVPVIPDPGAATAIATGDILKDEAPDVAALRLFRAFAGKVLYGWQLNDETLIGCVRAMYIRGRAEGLRAAPRVEPQGPTAIGNPTDNMAIERTRTKLTAFLRPNVNTLHPDITEALRQLFIEGTAAAVKPYHPEDGPTGDDSEEAPRVWPIGAHPPFAAQVDINETLAPFVQNGVIKCTYARVVDATQAACRRAWEAACDFTDAKEEAARAEEYAQGRRHGWGMGWQAAWTATRTMATHGLANIPPMPEVQPVEVEGPTDATS
jgi:hypothetical protein